MPSAIERTSPTRSVSREGGGTGRSGTRPPRSPRQQRCDHPIRPLCIGSGSHTRERSGVSRRWTRSGRPSRLTSSALSPSRSDATTDPIVIVGRIVNVSSGAGSLTLNSDPNFPFRSHWGTYPASKTALNATTLALAIELENTASRSVAVSPSYTATASQRFPRNRQRRGGGCLPVRPPWTWESLTGSFTGPEGPLAPRRTDAAGTLGMMLMTGDTERTQKAT